VRVLEVNETGTTIPVMYDDRYVLGTSTIDTTVKSRHVAKSLVDRPIEGVVLRDPSGHADATRRILGSIHDPAYVAAIETGEPGSLAASPGLGWDPDSFAMALAHNAGVVAATAEALDGATRAGTLSSGLHHARYSEGGGYCTFNGLAAATHLAIERGARVLIVDFDAHGGGGTWDIVHDVHQWTRDDRVVQIDLSVSPFDRWEPEGTSRYVESDKARYLHDAEALLDHAASLGAFDLVIYNAGVDPVNVVAVDSAMIAERERMVSEFIANTPAVFTLAGGYTWCKEMSEIVDLHRHVIAEWAGHRTTR